MKKVLIYSLLVLFLFNSTGYYFLYELNKHIAQREMSMAMQRDAGKISVLKVERVSGDKAFQRINKKEIRFHGVLYDVVREMKSGTATLFICVHDDRETSIVAGFSKINRNKLDFSLWDQMVMFFFTSTAFDLCPPVTLSVDFAEIDVTLQSSMLPNWSPPPECA